MSVLSQKDTKLERRFRQNCLKVDKLIKNWTNIDPKCINSKTCTFFGHSVARDKCNNTKIKSFFSAGAVIKAATFYDLDKLKS